MITIRCALPLGALLLVLGCASHRDEAEIRIPIGGQPDAEAPELEARALAAGPELDQRSPEDNQLELIQRLRDERTALEDELRRLRVRVEEAESTATLARRSEIQLGSDLERLQTLLADAGKREQELQRELVLARIAAVKQEQEAVRARIRELGETQQP